MPSLKTQSNDGVVVIGDHNGVVLIPSGTQLTRLNYFDGKFLRAEDLRIEQEYLRNLVSLSNQAGGAGVVHGYDTTLDSDDQLLIGPGLAIDGQGRALLMPKAMAISINTLLGASQQNQLSSSKKQSGKGVFGDCEIHATSTPGEVLDASQFFLVTLGWVEAYCGEEDVYGKLCEQSCISSTDRPNILEGVVVRAIPLNLNTPFLTSNVVPLTGVHIRSLVASAYFADERSHHASLISGEGLRSNTWCLGSRLSALWPDVGSDVPIALIDRAGSTTTLLDPWIPRRERMESPSRQYWAWKMAMRPWNMFLAQVLQFQCQLQDLFQNGVQDPGKPDDPCAEVGDVLQDASDAMGEVYEYYSLISKQFAQFNQDSAEGKSFSAFPTLKGGATELKSLQMKLENAVRILGNRSGDRILIDGGIVELPSAGYLPVAPSSTVSVNTQVRNLLGEGVDLRFCVVRPDFVAHALEEAQHMDRISLLQGLDNPKDKPKVDILVPEGHIRTIETVPTGTGYEMWAQLYPTAESLILSLAINKDKSKIDAFAKNVTQTQSILANARERLGDDLSPDLTRLSQGLSVGLKQVRNDGFYGAARGEKLPTGGWGFHYAGLLEIPQAPPKEQSPQQVLELIGDKGTLAVGNTVANSDSSDQETSSGQKILWQSGPTLNTGSRINTNVSSLTQNYVGRLEKKRLNPSALPLWTSMRTDRDPFALGRNDITQVSMETDFLFPLRSKIGLIEISFHGQLRVTNTGSTDAIEAQIIRGHLGGTAMIRVSDPGTGGTSLANQLPISEDITLNRTAGAGALPTVHAVIPLLRLLSLFIEVPLEFRSKRQHTENGALVTASIIPMLQTGFKDKEIPKDFVSFAGVEAQTIGGKVIQETAATATRELPLFDVKQKRNQDVFNPAHPAHTASLTALRQLAEIKDDDRYVDDKGRLLFPPPPPPSSELEVDATADWVLFHRRRDKQCGEKVKPAVKIPARKYWLYQVDLKNQATVASFAKAMADPLGSVSTFKPDQVTLVEFAPGLSTLDSSHGDVLADWSQEVKGSQQIVYNAIASQGDVINEGPNMADARLISVVDVVDDKTPLAKDVETDILGHIPNGLDAHGKDGVIVVATTPLEKVCHEVYRLTSIGDSFEEYIQNSKDIKEALTGSGANFLGTVEFVAGTDTVCDGTTVLVTEAWKEAGNGILLEYYVILKKDQEIDASKAQGIKIAQDVTGSPGTGGKQLDTSGDLGGNCPAITVLVPQAEAPVQTVCHNVYRLPSQAIEKFEAIMAEVDNVSAKVWGEVKAIPLGIVEFVSGTAQVFNQSSIPVTKAWEDSGNGELLQRYVITGKVTNQDTEVAEAQSAQIAFDTTKDKQSGKHLEISEILAGDCPAITVLVPQPETNNFAVITESLDHKLSTLDDLSSTLQFDAEDKVIRTDAFNQAINEWKESGVTLESVELTGQTKPKSGNQNPQLKAVTQLLKEEGLMTSSSTSKARKRTASEQTKVDKLAGGEVSEAFVFKMRK